MTLTSLYYIAGGEKAQRAESHQSAIIQNRENPTLNDLFGRVTAPRTCARPNYPLPCATVSAAPSSSRGNNHIRASNLWLALPPPPPPLGWLLVGTQIRNLHESLAVVMWEGRIWFPLGVPRVRDADRSISPPARDMYRERNYRATLHACEHSVWRVGKFDDFRVWKVGCFVIQIRVRVCASADIGAACRIKSYEIKGFDSKRLKLFSTRSINDFFFRFFAWLLFILTETMIACIVSAISKNNEVNNFLVLSYSTFEKLFCPSRNTLYEYKNNKNTTHWEKDLFTVNIYINC